MNVKELENAEKWVVGTFGAAELDTVSISKGGERGGKER
jgi:hypothetical protein